MFYAYVKDLDISILEKKDLNILFGALNLSCSALWRAGLVLFIVEHDSTDFCLTVMHDCRLCHVRKLLHTKERQEETHEQLRRVLGDSCISCELQLADKHHEARQGTSSISPAVAEELFASEYSKKECHMQALSADLTQLKKAVVNVDNSLSPSHTLLQIHCVDHKGLLYDIVRTLKDHDVKV